MWAKQIMGDLFLTSFDGDLSKTVENSWSKTLQGLVGKMRCPFVGSFLTGKPWNLKQFSRKALSFNNIKRAKIQIEIEIKLNIYIIFCQLTMCYCESLNFFYLPVGCLILLVL